VARLHGWMLSQTCAPRDFGPFFFEPLALRS
jgi:hypothetical protein